MTKKINAPADDTRAIAELMIDGDWDRASQLILAGRYSAPKLWKKAKKDRNLLFLTETGLSSEAVCAFCLQAARQQTQEASQARAASFSCPARQSFASLADGRHGPYGGLGDEQAAAVMEAMAASAPWLAHESELLFNASFHHRKSNAAVLRALLAFGLRPAAGGREFRQACCHGHYDDAALLLDEHLRLGIPVRDPIEALCLRTGVRFDDRHLPRREMMRSWAALARKIAELPLQPVEKPSQTASLILNTHNLSLRFGEHESAQDTKDAWEFWRQGAAVCMRALRASAPQIAGDDPALRVLGNPGLFMRLSHLDQAERADAFEAYAKLALELGEKPDDPIEPDGGNIFHKIAKLGIPAEYAQPFFAALAAIDPESSKKALAQADGSAKTPKQCAMPDVASLLEAYELRYCVSAKATAGPAGPKSI